MEVEVEVEVSPSTEASRLRTMGDEMMVRMSTFMRRDEPPRCVGIDDRPLRIWGGEAGEGEEGGEGGGRVRRWSEH